jgi:FkbM family methyltransferase
LIKQLLAKVLPLLKRTPSLLVFQLSPANRTVRSEIWTFSTESAGFTPPLVFAILSACEQMDSNPIKEILLGGHPLKIRGVSADDGYFASITSDFEPEFCSLCSRLVLPDYVCIDVGANIGVKSLFLSRHCHRGQVVAIEAAPTVVQCLEANIAANNATNIRVEKTAVGDRKGSVSFTENSAWGHVSQNGSEVPITTLAEIVQRLGLPRVDFIKIDVEGSEFSIMRSSLELINRFECLVLVELNSWAQLAVANVNPREFIDWLLVSFSHVFILRRSTGDLLEPVTNGLALLHRNLVTDGCVTDLLLTNAERRLRPSPDFLGTQLKASTARCASLYAELNEVRGDCEAAKAECNAARNERDGWKAECEAAKAECNAARNERDGWKAECEAAIAQLNATQAKVKALSNSWSWRVTTPFRWIRDHLPKTKEHRGD